jgi:hypothetical protein
MPGEMKQRFARTHLTSAIECGISAAEIEKSVIKSDKTDNRESISIHEGGIERDIGRWRPVLRSYVITSTIQCYSFLDTFVNETADKARDNTIRYDEEDELSKRVAEFMDIYKETGYTFSDLSTFNKYQIILYISEAEQFDAGREPYQSAKLVREVRHYFLHHEPEWIKKHEDDTHADDLSKALETKSFSTSPILTSDSYRPLFPHKCLSSSFSKWCITSVMEFARGFRRRTDITGNQPIVVDRISSELDYLDAKIREIEGLTET